MIINMKKNYNFKSFTIQINIAAVQLKLLSPHPDFLLFSVSVESKYSKNPTFLILDIQFFFILSANDL